MTGSMKLWATVIIVGILALGAFAVSGNSKSASADRAAQAAEENTRIARDSAARTECIRGLAAELDHARWGLVGQAFYATDRDDLRRIGRQLNNLPLVTDLTDHGGHILGERVAACPPAPIMKGTP